MIENSIKSFDQYVQWQVTEEHYMLAEKCVNRSLPAADAGLVKRMLGIAQ